MFYGEFPAGFVDHINHDRCDNRISNLRVVATKRENCRNQAKKQGLSGICGVLARPSKRWQAQIKGDGKLVCLGTFDTKEEAAAARQAANEKYGYHKNHGK